MRTWLYRLGAVALGLLLLALVEGVLRLVPDLRPAPLVSCGGSHGGRQLCRIEPLYPQRYFHQRHNGKYIARGRMAARPFEPGAAFRVVWLGASTVRGYPHPRHLAAASFLEAMLDDALPDSSVDVHIHNLGITALASYPIRLVLEDALALDPDAVVVYTGHNEFYGLYGGGAGGLARWDPLIHGLMQLRLARALRMGMDRFLGSEVATEDLANIMAKRGLVLPDSPRRIAARDRLEDSLRDMASLCAERDLPLVICSLAANEAGFAPVRSPAPQLDDNARLRWEGLVAEAAEQALQNAAEAAERALTRLEDATDLGPESAWVAYLRGCAYRTLGDAAAARAAFRRARALDTMPWRAPRTHSEVVRVVASSTSAVLADVELAFDGAAPPAGVGWDLMADHVHPTVAGQVLMARVVAVALAKALEPRGGPQLRLDRLDHDSEYRKMLGDLPALRVRTLRAMSELLSWPPMDRYNAHNANLLRHRAETEWKALSPGEQQGLQKHMVDPGEGTVALDVADALLEAGEFDRAAAYYAASVLADPYRVMSDLWATARWAHAQRLAGRAIGASGRQRLRAALGRCDLALDADEFDVARMELVRGQLLYFLGEHEQALAHFERGLGTANDLRKYGAPMFPFLADELVRAGRTAEARRQAMQLGGELAPQALRLVSHLEAGVPLLPPAEEQAP